MLALAKLDLFKICTTFVECSEHGAHCCSKCSSCNVLLQPNQHSYHYKHCLHYPIIFAGKSQHSSSCKPSPPFSPPKPEPSSSRLGTADVFKQLQDEVSALRCEVFKALASETQPPQASPEEEPSPRPKHHLALHPANPILRAELDSLKSCKACATKGKRSMEPEDTMGGKVSVPKEEHKDFFKDVSQKKSLLAKVAPMPVDDWVASQPPVSPMRTRQTMLC